MAYIILAIGFALGVYGLYKFMRRATRQEAALLLLSIIVTLLVLMMVVLLITGRLPAAGAMVALLVPLSSRLYTLYRRYRNRP